tara:strand:+ start:4602 stop:5021 length:420 start_codon:yes stop_codon:yes gene_type:complete
MKTQKRLADSRFGKVSNDNMFDYFEQKLSVIEILKVRMSYKENSKEGWMNGEGKFLDHKPYYMVRRSQALTVCLDWNVDNISYGIVKEEHGIKFATDMAIMLAEQKIKYFDNPDQQSPAEWFNERAREIRAERLEWGVK